jgi:transposase, IS5 family
MHQIEMVILEELVSSEHSYRRFKDVFDFSKARTIVERIERDDCYTGYGAFRLFLCCLLQYLEDLSDRELERFIVENNSAKWFCGFSLTEKTPDHTVFCAFRKRLGAQKLSEIFAVFRDQLKARGLMNEVFSFVDATILISKANLWEERDCAKQKSYEALNIVLLLFISPDGLRS